MIQDLFFWMALASSVAIFWLLPLFLRNGFLALFSFTMLCYYDVKSGLALLLLSVFQFYIISYMAKRSIYSPLFLITNIVTILTPLIYFKFYLVSQIDMTVSLTSAGDLLVPLGMSYYSFRMIHVAVEAYRQKEFEYTAKDYFCYIFLFTIIVAGPIQRLDNFVAEANHTFEYDNILHGLVRIFYGLIKQTAIIDLVNNGRQSLLPGSSYDLASAITLSSYELWALVFFAYLVSYLNLSAYTDFAIGSSRLFGFKIMENFNLPILATNLADFWRRWHMTLSGWCQAYVYLPMLGYSRSPYIALIVSFQVMGLWHVFSVNRIMWGIFHAFGVIVAVQWTRYARRTGIQTGSKIWMLIPFWILTQAFVSASWVFVLGENQNNIGVSFHLLLKLITFGVWT